MSAQTLMKHFSTSKTIFINMSVGVDLTYTHSKIKSERTHTL